jgi:membrane protease YdiL (CAAX protease family)
VKIDSTTAPAPHGTEERVQLNRKLAAFAALIATVAGINYAGNYAVSTSKSDTENALFHYSTAVGSIVVYGLILLLVLWIARDRRDLLAWRSPRTGWVTSIGIAIATLLAAGVVITAIDHVMHGGREQGVVPPHWLPAHAAAYAVNWVVVAGVAPFVEETTYRGLGFSLLDARWGFAAAAVGTGIAFALSHGLLRALPELFVFGVSLAWLRSRVDSTLPGMLVHCAFNSFALATVFWS